MEILQQQARFHDPHAVLDFERSAGGICRAGGGWTMLLMLPSSPVLSQ